MESENSHGKPIENTDGCEKAEEMMKASEEGYRAIFDAANDAIFIHDPSTGAILDVNRKMTEMYGYTVEEAVKLSVGDLSSGIPPYTQEGAVERIGRALSGESSPMFEWQARDREGRVFWIEVNLKQTLIHREPRIVAIVRDISERKRTEEALYESRSLLHAVIEGSPDPIFLKDRSGRFLLANPATLSAMGKTSMQVLGKRDSEIYSDMAIGLALMENDRLVLESGRTSVMEERIPTPGGDRVFLTTKSPYCDASGAAIGIIGIARDITERTKAEQELRESEERFRTLHEASFGGIGIHEKGVILDCNQGLADLTGYSVDELIGMDGLKLIAPAWRDYVMQRIVGGFGEPYDVEGMRKDGSIYPLEIQGKTIPYHGRTVRVTEFRDIAERKQAEAALRQSEERFRAAVDRFPDTFIIYDADRRFRFVNKHLIQVSGLAEEEILGHRDEEIFPHEEAGAYLPHLLRAIRTRQPQQAEVSISSGNIMQTLVVNYVPLLNEQGEIQQILGITMDITKHKQAEEKIGNLNTDLRRRVEELQTLLDVIPIGIGIAEGRESRTVRGNKTFEKILGMKQGANLSLSAGRDERPKSFKVLSHGRELGPDELPLQSAASRGTIVRNFEVEVVRDDGVTVSMLEFASPLHDVSGNIRGSVGAFLDITDRKRAEKALRASEERYRFLYDSMEQGVAEFDEAGNLVSVNQAANNILSMDLGKMLGRPFLQVFQSIPGAAQEDGAPFDVNNLPIMKTLKTGNSVLNKVVRFSGTGQSDHRWVSVDLIPRLHKGDSQDKELARVFVIFSDITEVKNAQESLRKTNEELEQKVKFRTRVLAQTVDQLKEQKEILQTIINNIPVMLTFYDVTGKVKLVNREFEKLAGWSLEEARTMDLMAAIYPDPHYRAEIWDSMMKEKSGWKDIGITTRSGSLLQSSWANVRLPDGSLVGIGIDITARKRMEQDLLRLAAAIRQAEEGIVLFSPDGIIEYVNPAYEFLTGYQPDELIGKTTTFFGVEMHERYQSVFTQIKDGGESWTGRMTRKHMDGSALEIILSVSPVRDETGHIINFVAVVQDVTREVLLQQQVSQNQKMEALGTLAGGIAHDLKNVLTPILINTEIALEDVGAENPVQPMLEEVLGAARIGSDLVKQIVTFSRQTPQEKKPVVISSIVKETLSFLRSSLPSTIEIHSRIHDECSTVFADPTQIKQVMINLGSNAGHAMKEQGGILEVELSDSVLSEETASLVSPDLSEGTYMKITVRDTGTGMDEKTVKHIFEPFFTTKKKGEGSGMGLAVVHGIVKGHQGAITVRSTPGEGSVFTVFLPRIERKENSDGCMNGLAS